MKQKDITLIVVIAAVSAIFSFLISGHIFVTPANRQQKVEAVDKITDSFQTPSNKYFNSNSVNPTPDSTVGAGDNGNPFNGQ